MREILPLPTTPRQVYKYCDICCNLNLCCSPLFHQVEKSELELPLLYPDPAKLQRLGLSIQHALGLDLVGIDVIVENVTGRYAVIDTNSFPGITKKSLTLYIGILYCLR